MSRSGGLVFCDTCEKIIASINKQGYRYINLGIVCSCGNYGHLEFIDEESTADPFERVNLMPNEKNGVAICKHCTTPLFGVIDGRVKNYSFYVECICGEKYDTKSNSGKRLGETVKILNSKSK